MYSELKNSLTKNRDQMSHEALKAQENKTEEKREAGSCRRQ